VRERPVTSPGWDVELPHAGWRPVVIITRDSALSYLRTVTVAEITTNPSTAPTSVPIQPSSELRLADESHVRCDNVVTLDQQQLASLRGHVSPEELADIGTALMIAFDL
jgi:mRNA-degrading endonuclease toxin of MazEF toxin-antitoxin module